MTPERRGEHGPFLTISDWNQFESHKEAILDSLVAQAYDNNGWGEFNVLWNIEDTTDMETSFIAKCILDLAIERVVTTSPPIRVRFEVSEIYENHMRFVLQMGPQTSVVGTIRSNPSEEYLRTHP